jgi:hypothetical protein
MSASGIMPKSIISDASERIKAQPVNPPEAAIPRHDDIVEPSQKSLDGFCGYSVLKM